MKEIKKTIGDIRRLVSYAASSLKIRTMKIEEKDGIKQLRSSIHLMLKARTGSLKSTILEFIADACPSENVDMQTLPGMIGTVENMMLVPGFAWKGRNKLLLFDEFVLGRNRDNNVMMLKLLEDQKFSRKFGRFIPDREPEHDGNLHYIVKNGSIDMKTKFSAIIATMRRFEHQRGDDFRALVNRCTVYSYNFTREEMDWLLEHTKLFIPITFNPDEETFIKWKTYKKIKNAAISIINSTDYPDWAKDENYARIVGDITRIHAVTKNISRKEIKNIINWKLDPYSRIGLDYKKEKDEKI